MKRLYALLCLSFVFTACQSQTNQAIHSDSPISISASPSLDTSLTAVSAGRYLTFSPNVLSSNTQKTTVLFFFANWCPTCIPVDQEFKTNNANIPANTTVIRVNYNDNDTSPLEKDLALKYGVTYQHTFVVLNDQHEKILTWNGGGIETLKSKLASI